MPKMAKFSTHILDEELPRRREERGALRRAVLAFSALKELFQRIPFAEAYLFGSVAKPYRFHPESDVDVVQLERVPFAERIKQEGIRWTKSN